MKSILKKPSLLDILMKILMQKVYAMMNKTKMELEIKTSKLTSEKKVTKETLRAFIRDNKEDIYGYKLVLISHHNWIFYFCFSQLLDEYQSRKSFQEDIEYLKRLYYFDEKLKLDAASLLIFSYCHFSNLLPRLNKNKVINRKLYLLQAIHLFKEEALKGNILPAEFVLNYLARNIKYIASGYHPSGMKENPRMAQEVLALLSQQNNKEAQYLLADCYLNGYFEKNTKRALELYHVLADKNHFYSLNKLAELYNAGIHVQKDEQQAFELYKKMAKLNYAKGWFEVAQCYIFGFKRNLRRGFEMLSELALFNPQYNNILFELGKCYLQGTGTSIDSHRAILLFLKDKALKEAQPKVSQTQIQVFDSVVQRAYHSTANSPKSIKEAVEMYNQTLDSDKLSAARLAFCYQYGLIKKIDLLSAIKYYKMAAKKNCQNAQWDLFFCFEQYLSNRALFQELNRMPCEIQLKDMLHWFESCSAKDPDANLILAKIYTNGKLVNMDLYKAYSFLQKALELNPDLKQESFIKEIDDLSPMPKIRSELLTFCWVDDATKTQFGKDICSIISEYALDLKKELTFQNF